MTREASGRGEVEDKAGQRQLNLSDSDNQIFRFRASRRGWSSSSSARGGSDDDRSRAAALRTDPALRCAASTCLATPDQARPRHTPTVLGRGASWCRRVCRCDHNGRVAEGRPLWYIPSVGRRKSATFVAAPGTPQRQTGHRARSGKWGETSPHASCPRSLLDEKVHQLLVIENALDNLS